MLGTRGCRLGIQWPEIYAMQVRAIIEAAADVLAETGEQPHVEIMIPLVGFEEELKRMRALTVETAEAVLKERGVAIDYTVGTMIEVPRAALTADEIARQADFFSFGTNDLTQMTLGFSRDDAEGKFLTHYLSTTFSRATPSRSSTRPAWGSSSIMAVQKGRAVKPDLKTGICGEHGGEPSSVKFCHRAGSQLRELQPVPGAAGPAGRRPGGAGREGGEQGRRLSSKAGLSSRGDPRRADSPASWAKRAWSRPVRAGEAGDAVKHERAGRVQFVRRPLRGGAVRVGAAVVGVARPRASRRALHSPHPLPARPRPHRPQQVVPPAQAQDPGLHRPGGRPLSHPADPHPRGVGHRPDGRAGACGSTRTWPRLSRSATTWATPLSATPARAVIDEMLHALGAGGFQHNEQSARVVEVLENDGRGLNLTWEVRDGIRHHSGEQPPATLEAKIVHLADRIAYVNHDIDDALRAGLITASDLPPEPIALLGESGSERIDTLVHDLVDSS